MTQQTHNPWNVAITGGAIAGVLTTVILAIFSSAREWLTYTAQYTNWSIALYVTIPFVIGVFVGIWLCRRSNSSSAHPQGQTTAQMEKKAPALPALDEIDRHVVRGLVSFDGEWASVDDLGNRVGRSGLVVERSLAKLIAHGYAKDFLAVGQESLYKLSPDGTTYAISNELDRVSR